MAHRILRVRHRAGGNDDIVVVGRGVDILHISVEMQLVGGVPLDVARQITRSLSVREVARLVLEVQSVAWIIAAHAVAAIIDKGKAGDGRAGVDCRLNAVVSAAEAPMRLRQQAGLEHAVVAERERRAAGQNRPRARIESARSEVVAVKNDVTGAFEPSVAIFGVDVLDRRAQISRRIFVLRSGSDAVPLAIVIDLREADAVRRVDEACAAERIGCAGDGAIGGHDRVVGGAEAGRAIGIDLVHDDAFGARDDMALRIVGEHTETTDRRVPVVADQRREFGRPPVRTVAIIILEVTGDQQTLLIERQPGPEVDSAGNAALDHLCGLVLVCIDASEKLGRDIVELKPSRRVSGEAVASVKLGAHLRQAADQHACRFARRMRGIVGGLKPADRDAGHTLQRLRGGLVREGADVGRGDRVDEGVGVLFDVLRGGERLADASDDDVLRRIVGRSVAGRSIAGGRLLRLRRRIRATAVLRPCGSRP